MRKSGAPEFAEGQDVQRKVFRIEETIAASGEHRRAPAPAAPGRDAAALHTQLAGHMRDLAALMHDGGERRMTLAAGELGAAIESMEKATQGILKSAESADHHARALAASLPRDDQRALARGIQEDVARIYEACNFQDLAGQRIAKVIETLGLIEAELARMLHGDGALAATDKRNGGFINGPKLDGASGHVSQQDIDMLFG